MRRPMLGLCYCAASSTTFRRSLRDLRGSFMKLSRTSERMSGNSRDCFVSLTHSSVGTQSVVQRPTNCSGSSFETAAIKRENCFVLMLFMVYLFDAWRFSLSQCLQRFAKPSFARVLWTKLSSERK